MASVNDITVIVVGVVVGVVGLLISDAIITAGNFSGTVSTLINLVPIVLASVILFIGIRGLMF
jgi:ribosomal protein L18E